MFEPNLEVVPIQSPHDRTIFSLLADHNRFGRISQGINENLRVGCDDQLRSLRSFLDKLGEVQQGTSGWSPSSGSSMQIERRGLRMAKDCEQTEVAKGTVGEARRRNREIPLLKIELKHPAEDLDVEIRDPLIEII